MDKKKLEIESLFYRMRKMDAKYYELKNLISGNGKSYEELLKTKSGKYSSKQISLMVNDLVDCLKEYRMYTDSVQRGHLAEMENINFSEEDLEFYEAYFYLMLGIATHDNSYWTLTRYCVPGTWGALLERVDEEMEYVSEAEIDADLLVFSLPGLDQRIPAGFFTDMYMAYESVTDENLTDLLSEEARKAACKLLTKQEISYLKNPQKKLEDEQKEQEELNKLMEDPDFWPDDFEPLTDEEYEEVMEADAENYWEGFDTTPDKWSEYFRDKEKFKQSCLTVKNGIAKRIDKGNEFRKEIRMAVELYLWKKGISEMSDDDKFTVVYAYLNKAVKASEIKLAEIKISENRKK